MYGYIIYDLTVKKNSLNFSQYCSDIKQVPSTGSVGSTGSFLARLAEGGSSSRSSNRSICKVDAFNWNVVLFAAQVFI